MKKYKVFINKIESIILLFCILCISLLVLFQGFFKKDSSAVFLTFNQLDYEHDNENEIGYIIFKTDNSDFSNVAIIVNGKDKYIFGKKEEVKVKVHNNDIIEIDASMYNEQVIIKISGISKNVVFPELSSEILTNSRLEIVGRVILN